MYGFSLTYSGTLEQAVAAATAALAAEGFGILTQIDVDQTLRSKIGVEVRPYKILGACNPSLAHRALEVDPDIGLLLPCNVVVREEADGTVTIAFMDPEAVLSLTDNPAVAALSSEVRERLQRVHRALSAKDAA
ncbi:MAG TPA: DUF302 domain-containing protein [Gammaproteobacteria bacterium]|nr:DUF302 domain-containing protein [Gammaproteobacteria bacterium]